MGGEIKVGPLRLSPSTQNSSVTRFGLGADSFVFLDRKTKLRRSIPTHEQSSLLILEDIIKNAIMAFFIMSSR